MTFLRILAAIFLFPGNVLLSALNISVSDDGGILRSLVNMIFWGFIGVVIGLAIMF